MDGSAGSVVKNVAIVTAEAPDGTKLPEARAEAQYTIVNKDGTIPQGTQGSAGSSGGGAQTGRDGLLVWALVIAAGAVLVATVVLIRRKKRK